MDTVVALKEQGNVELMQNKNYDKAEELYTTALNLDPRSIAVLSNRSLCRYSSGKFSESLADADAVLELDKTWLKGHYHRVRALQALRRPEEARIAFSEGFENGGNKNASFLSLEEAVSKDYIALHYDKLTQHLNVEVKWIDSLRGKGLFAKKEIRMFQPIFSEEPLVSHRKLFRSAPNPVNTKDEKKEPNMSPIREESCSYCMRSFAQRSDVAKTKFERVWGEIYPNGRTPNYIWCENCEKRKEEVLVTDPKLVVDPFLAGNPFFLEKYCSEPCRDKADHLWHRCLCAASFVSDPDGGRIHPLHRLYGICAETGRYFPLMICRIYAIVFQRIMRGAAPPAAFQDFRNFVSSEVESPGDQEAIFLLKNLFVLPVMESLLTLSHYRRLNGAIMRNAQTINPVSDVHMWFEKELQKEKDGTSQEDVMKKLGFTPDTLKHYMATPQMLHLNKIEGGALLSVANCMNHSCDPNVISSSSSNDHTATFVALRPIEAGEELCISYVDDNLTWEERNKMLRDFYQFDCKCIRCHVQKEKLKILE